MSVLADLRIAVRTLLRSPGLFGLAALVLALGISAVVVMFGFLRVVTAPPPLPRMDRVFSLSTENVRHDEPEHTVALQDIEDWGREQTSFEGVAGVASEMVAFRRVGADVEPLLAGRVTGTFFPLLRVKPLLGRNLLPADALPNAAPVLVLSERLWRSAFKADPSVLGLNVLVNGDPYEVVGVAPASLDLPVSAQLWFADRTYTGWDPQLGGPLSRLRGPRLFPIGRLRDGVTPEAARTELRAIQARRVGKYPLVATEIPDVRPLSLLWLGGDTQRLRGVLLGSVLLVLALACVNVTGLLLVRGAGCMHEAAVRRALGAGRLRLARRMLAESAVIGAAAALLALVLSAGSMELLGRVVPAVLPAPPSWWRMRLDGITVAFALGTAAVATLAAGLSPALRAAGARIDPLLRNGQRENALHAGGLVPWLVVLEIALSSVLLTAASLVIRSASALGTGDVGVPTDGFLMVRIELPQRYAEADPWNFAWRLTTRIRVIPGVESIAVSTSPPGIRALDAVDFGVAEPRQVRVDALSSAAVTFATPGFFESFRIPVRGRPFVDADNDPRDRVAVVSESLARTAWPGEDPVGKTLWIAPGESFPPLRVVGVASDVRYHERLRRLGAQPPVVYLCLFQSTQRPLYVTLRARRDALAVAEAVRMTVRSMDFDVPVFSVRSLDEERRRNAAPLILVGRMFAVFGAVAVALAAAGVYGVIAYSVADGAREIAIRRALGASPTRIVITVLARSGWQLALGLALGMVLAPAVGAAVGSVVLATAPGLSVYLGVAAVLGGTLVASMVIPLWRALSLEPAAALRHS